MRRLLFLLLLWLIAWFWWNSMAARQRAREVAKNTCAKYGVQLIDDTVERISLRITRDQRGQMALARLYQFEFTTDGSRRYKGYIATMGHHIIDVKLDPYTVD